MQKHHGDVSNSAIYVSLPHQSYLGVKKEFHLYSLISNPEISPDFCHNKLSKSWEACAGTGCKNKKIWLAKCYYGLWD